MSIPPSGVRSGPTSYVAVPATAIPQTCPVDVNAARTQLIDAVVEADETLMEKYLTEGKVSVAELEADITKAMDAGTLIPIFCTAAKKDLGVKELMLSDARGLARMGVGLLAGERCVDVWAGQSGGEDRQRLREPGADDDTVGRGIDAARATEVGGQSCAQLGPAAPRLALAARQPLAQRRDKIVMRELVGPEG